MEKPKKDKKQINYGSWECHKCGSVFFIFVSEYPHCSMSNIKTISTTDGTENNNFSDPFRAYNDDIFKNYDIDYVPGYTKSITGRE